MDKILKSIIFTNLLLINIIGACNFLNTEPGIGSTMKAKDGMTMVFVPAGTFSMGDDEGEYEEKPVHQVYLDAFWIDQTEVTNEMYSQCVWAIACREQSDVRSYTRDSYYGNPKFDDYPVINVDWNMAKAYCAWRGDRLPSEAEWEKAARGTDGRTYPWGESIDCDKANYQNSCVGDTTRVKSYESGKSPFGAYDMAGNVLEWVSSSYKSYPYSATDGREDLSKPDTRALRGGAWNDFASYSRTTHRNGYSPTDTGFSLGFRCVHTVKAG